MAVASALQDKPPSGHGEGGEVVMDPARSSRQPLRRPWTREELVGARTLALGFSLESSTRSTYQSGLNSYLAFADAHNFPLPPTIDSISFFVVYMSHHIDPKSVASYVHGLMRCLEPYYPQVRAICRSPLVKETLAGCKKWRGKPTLRKPPLLATHILTLIGKFNNAAIFDDSLFLVISLLGHFGLHRLGELTSSDVIAHRSHRKLIKRPTAIRTSIGFSYVLPYHKADRYFLGNTVVIPARSDSLDPTEHLVRFLHLRDAAFPNRIELLIRSDGSLPTRSWYMDRLKLLFPSEGFGGHSLRAGGATELALHGTLESLIRRIGRWSSDAWERYIRVHPVLLSAVLQTRNTPVDASLITQPSSSIPSTTPIIGLQ